MMSWSDLAAGTLARQFPAEVEPGDVAGLLAAVGPIQSQTARSVFIGMAARLPGVTRAQLSAAYESSAIVRGSTLRGTVHTSSAALHPLLEVATRLGQRALWSRTLKPSETTLEQIWASIEDFARDKGLAHIEGLVLANNPNMLRLMRGLGYEVRPFPEDPDFKLVVRAL